MLSSVDSVDISSYTDDNTTYIIGKNKCEVENKLEILSAKLFEWFHENGMKANQGKYYFLSSLEIATKLSLIDSSVENSCFEEFLGVIFDGNLKFNEHVQICAQ